MSSSRRPLAATVVVVVALALGVAIVGGVVSGQTSGADRGEPDLEVYLPDAEVQPESVATVELQVGNDADLISGRASGDLLTARSVTVEVTDDGPFDVTTGETPIGTVPDGESVPVPIELEVPADVEPGVHEIEVELGYSYTDTIGSQSGDSRTSATETHDVTVVVAEDPRFSIAELEAHLAVGADGELSGTVVNEGNESVDDAVLAVEPATESIEIPDRRYALPTLEAGEAADFRFLADVASEAADGPRQLQFTVEYTDEVGTAHEFGPVAERVVVSDEDRFEVSDLEDSLSVGYEGEVTGELVYRGDVPIDDGVLVVEPMTDSLHVEDTRYALPELEPGDPVDFRYPVDVSGTADDGPRQLRFTVEYTDRVGTQSQSRPISERVVVDGHADEFALDGEVVVEAGTTSEFTLEITNQRDETLSNVDARLYDDGPLTATNDEAFVDELEPGETAELPFAVRADEGASTETHPVELDFEYRTERGETQLSDSYLHPVEVVPNADGDDGGGNTAGSILGLAGALLAASLGAAWWRRR